METPQRSACLTETSTRSPGASSTSPSSEVQTYFPYVSLSAFTRTTPLTGPRAFRLCEPRGDARCFPGVRFFPFHVQDIFEAEGVRRKVASTLKASGRQGERPCHSQAAAVPMMRAVFIDRAVSLGVNRSILDAGRGLLLLHGKFVTRRLGAVLRAVESIGLQEKCAPAFARV